MNVNCANCNNALPTERRDLGFRLCVSCAEKFAKENRDFIEQTKKETVTIKATLLREKREAEERRLENLKKKNVTNFFEDFARVRSSEKK